MSNEVLTTTTKDYEARYQNGYGLIYPESHIIRVHRHILQWELKQEPDAMFDFGCGSGQHAWYFAQQGYTPHGCDVSETAIQQAKSILPNHADNFFVNQAGDLSIWDRYEPNTFNLWMSNQVLYYLSDADIRAMVERVYSKVKPGGAFVVSMKSYHSWYAQYITASEGDFKKIEIKTARVQSTSYINFKRKDELAPLFAPFKSLHIGQYGEHIREDEGATTHWLFVGIKEA